MLDTPSQITTENDVPCAGTDFRGKSLVSLVDGFQPRNPCGKKACLVNTIHLHLPKLDTDEELHLVLHYDGASDLYLDSDDCVGGLELPTQADVPGDAASSAETDGALEDLFQRFEGYEPQTPVRKLVATLEATGWQPLPPAHRESTENRLAYIRALYRGAHGRRTVYLNSSNVVVDSTPARDLMLAQPGAEASGRKVVFPFMDEIGPAGVEQALAAIEELRRSVDRQ